MKVIIINVAQKKSADEVLTFDVETEEEADKLAEMVEAAAKPEEKPAETPPAEASATNGNGSVEMEIEVPAEEAPVAEKPAAESKQPELPSDFKNSGVMTPAGFKQAVAAGWKDIRIVEGDERVRYAFEGPFTLVGAWLPTSHPEIGVGFIKSA